MVYCGKASQGCQSCRVRRIKCDKLKPDCSQCVRVGKKCPGYRDQLSLMFRDESSKVIQKAHAQWGVGEGSDGSPVAPTPTSSSSPTPSFGSHHSPATPPSPPLSQAGWSSTVDAGSSSTAVTPVNTATRLCSSIQPSLHEQGTKFFFSHYVIGHPDEPKSFAELRNTEWFSAPGLQDIMTAVGLASLANLNGRPDLVIAARQYYGTALRQAGQDIQAGTKPSLTITVRSVVSLALFELVNGQSEDINTIHAHIMGGVALMREWFPLSNAAFGGIRGLIQLCYSMFVVADIGGKRLPPAFGDWLAFARSMQPPQDFPSTDLGDLLARFTNLSSFVRNHTLSDGGPTTTSTLQQLADLDREFEKWERERDGIWGYTVHKAMELPHEAIFEGEYHTYYDMWAARIWGHYRWGRLQINHIMLDLIDRYPGSNQALARSIGRAEVSSLIRRMSREILVSTSSHWRHPLLGPQMPLPLEVVAGAGSGPAGIGLLIYHLKAAGCAHGVPFEYGDWAQRTLECIWRDMGMLRARSMMEAVTAHQEARKQKRPEQAKLWVNGDGRECSV